MSDLTTTRSWMGYYATVLIILAILAVWSALEFEQYMFNEVTASAIVGLLTSLFVIAVFVERGQEVFITTWRGVGRACLETALANAKKQEDEILGEKREDAIKDARTARDDAERALQCYKATTKRVAFIAGISAGVLISMAGVRVLYPLLNWDIEYTGAQQIIFNFVDVFLTGGLIGGGSDGIHKIMSVILDFVDLRRAMLKKNAEQLNRQSP